MPLFAKKIKPTDENICPFIGSPCIKSRCVQWIHIAGKHPQTGADIDLFDCSIKWMPLLTIENSNQSRQTASAIESFRNEMVRQGEQAIQIGRADPQAKIGIADDERKSKVS